MRACIRGHACLYASAAASARSHPTLSAAYRCRCCASHRPRRPSALAAGGLTRAALCPSPRAARCRLLPVQAGISPGLPLMFATRPDLCKLPIPVRQRISAPRSGCHVSARLHAPHHAHLIAIMLSPPCQHMHLIASTIACPTKAEPHPITHCIIACPSRTGVLQCTSFSPD